MSEKELTGYPSIDKPWLKYYDAEFLEKPLPSMNIYSYLKHMTKDYGKLTALSFFGKEISYAELMTNIDIAAKILINKGVKAGDRIMYLMPNIPETAYFLYGGARLSAVADYIDPRPDSVDFQISAQKVLAMFKEEGAKYLVSLDQCYLAMIKPIEQELKALGVEEIILVRASDSMDGKTKLNYLQETFAFNGFSALLKSLVKTNKITKLVEESVKNSVLKLVYYKDLISTVDNVELPLVEYEKNQLAVIVHTSGTSSAKPKPIPLTHDNMNCAVHSMLGSEVPFAPQNTELHILPYFAAYGIVTNLHCALCAGHKLFEIPEFLIDNLGKIIKKTKVEMILGTPSWLLGILNSKELRGFDMSHFKMVTYGGDGMDIKDEERVNLFLKEHNCGCILTKGHGMSETSGGAAYAAKDYNIPGTIGIPMPHTTYAIVDPETKEMLKFEDNMEYLEGELIISSGAVTPGVLDGKVIVPHQDYDGESYIYTRDIARMDREGIITFLSRSDRSITRFDGYKIKPYEVENIIKAYSGIQYCIISPLYDNEKFGNVAIADIVLQDGSVPERLEQLQLVEKIVQSQFINNSDVSARQIPAWFRFRESLPLTVNSKVNYNALAKEALKGNEIQVCIEETNISVDKIVVK